MLEFSLNPHLGFSMKTPLPSTPSASSGPAVAEFDAYSENYEAHLPFLKLAGESKDFYAQSRVQWLAQRLAALGIGAPRRVLDFGCGTGSATPFLLADLQAGSVVGVDPSVASLNVARATYRSQPAQFFAPDEFTPDGSMDLAVCNGVFHHVPLAERLDAARYVFRALKPGGLFAFWENNPWNPLMLYGMKHTPLDANAIPVSVRKAHRLIDAAGFTRLRTDFLFLFPAALRALRPIEPLVCRLPIGAQFEVLSRKPV